MRTDLLLSLFDAKYRNLRDAALVTEAVGFDGLWLVDHLSGIVHGKNHVLECWTSLTALATEVPRISIGPLVLNVANRRPEVLAVMAATLQEVCEGRLLLGLGAGGGAHTPFAAEQRMFGVAVPAAPIRRAAVAETIATLTHVWSGEDTGFLRPEPSPPVIVAGFSVQMAELAGQVGDGFNTRAAHPRLRNLIAVACDAHAERAESSSSFLVTVFAELADRWLRPGSTDRSRLEHLGVDRLILLCDPPFDLTEIRAAGRLLHSGQPVHALTSLTTRGRPDFRSEHRGRHLTQERRNR